MADQINTTTTAPQPKVDNSKEVLLRKINRAIAAEVAKSGRTYRDYTEEDIVQACVDKVHGLMYRYDRHAEERAVIKAWRNSRKQG